MTTSPRTRPDLAGAPAGLTRGTLLAAALGVGVAQVGLTVPAVLNGTVNLDLSTTSTQLTWVSDAFLVPITLFELTFGVVGDLFGRKRLMAAGAGLMALGTLLAFLTPGPSTAHGTRVGFLITGQVIGGIGAAAIFPTSVAILAAATRTVKERSRAISVWAAALTGAGVITPVAAGLLVRIHHSGGADAGWRWAFLALALAAVLSAVVTLVAATDSKSPEGRSLDWPGQITVAVALFALLYAVIEGAERGWGSTVVITGFVVAAVFLVLFVLVEQRVAKPLLQLELFSNRIFVATAVVTVIGMFAYLGTGYATSIRLSAIQGYSPLMTAIGFVAFNVMGVVLFPVSARMIERHNPGWTLVAGMALIAVGDLVLAAIPATNLSIAAICVPLLAAGAGFKLAVTSITVVAINSVPTSRAGMASGATSMLRDFGLTLGPAIVGSIGLTRAAGEISDKIAASPKLSAAVDSFNAAPAGAPAAQRPELEAAVGAVNSGPLGANAVPPTVQTPDGVVPFNPLHDVAFHALSNGFAVGYLVCGIAALVAAVLAALLLGGRSQDTAFDDETTRAVDVGGDDGAALPA